MQLHHSFITGGSTTKICWSNITFFILGKSTCIDISPDSNQVVSGFEDKICIWFIPGKELIAEKTKCISLLPNLPLNKQLFLLLGDVFSVRISPNSQLVAFYDCSTPGIQICRTSDLSFIRTLCRQSDPVLNLSFHPNSRLLLTCSKSGQIHCWNVKMGALCLL